MAKKRKGKGRAACAGCGRGIGRKDVACRRCGARQLALAGKSAAVTERDRWLAKAHAEADPGMRVGYLSKALGTPWIGGGAS